MMAKKCVLGVLFLFLVGIMSSFPMQKSSVVLANINNENMFVEVMTEDEGREEPTIPDVEPEERFKVSVQVVGEGTVELTPNAEDYLKDSVVKVEVTAKAGWTFDKIEGVELDENNSFTVVEDVTIVATFLPNPVSFKDEEKGVSVDATADILPIDASMQVSMVESEDERYSQVRSALSTPNKLQIFDITFQTADNQPIEQLDELVTVKIKLDEMFDSQKVKLIRVELNPTSVGKTDYQFEVVDGFLVFQTDHFSMYTLSQATGFKPASPSKDGTNKMALTLIVLGLSAVVAVIAVTVAVLVNRKKK